MLSRFGDLLIDSEVALPALSPSAGVAECFVRVDSATAPDEQWDHHWRAPDGAAVLSCARDGDAYRLGVPGLASFLIDASGREITCRPERDLPADTLEHLVIDQVLPRVLAHRGRLVLHAGCVATPEGAIALLGDSGAGKSTLCAALARAGHDLVGDDGIVARGAAGGGFEVFATYPGLRLFADPLASLFGHLPRCSPLAHYSSKRRLAGLEAGLAFATACVPLRALYVLDAGPEIGTSPVTGTQAFTEVLRASYQLHLGDAERSRRLFDSIAALIEAVPVRRLTYPRELSRLAAVCDAVVSDAIGPAAAMPTGFSPASSGGCACS